MLQRGAGALETRLCLPAKVLKQTPLGRNQRMQDPGLRVALITALAVTDC